MGEGRVAAELPALAYQLALRSLDHQESGLDELRARTNTLLAAAAVRASLLGAPAIQRGGVSIWLLLALLAFGACVGLCLFVLIPTELTFAINGPEVYEALFEHANEPNEVHRQLACWLQSFHTANLAPIRRRRARFRDAALALGAQIVLLAVALTVT
jgi:hypothetical protein